MTVAISVARRRGRRGRGVRLDRQHLGVDGGVRRAGRHQAARAGAAGQDRRRQAGPGDRARRPGRSWCAATSTTACGSPAALAERLPGRAGQLGQPDAARGAEDRRLRDRRLPRRRPGRARAAGRQRRQHLGVLEGLPASTPTPAAPRDARGCCGFQAAGAAPAGAAAQPVADPETVATAIRIGNPASWDLAGGRAPTSPAAGSARSPTSRSSPPSASWPPATASSSSRPRRPASPGCSPSSPRATSYAGQTVVVTVTGHGLKDIDTALSTFADLVDTVVDADVDAAAAGGRAAS